MQAWWEDERYDSHQPMNFSRRDSAKQEVIRVPPTKKEIDAAPKNAIPPHERVRIFVGR